MRLHNGRLEYMELFERPLSDDYGEAPDLKPRYNIFGFD